MTVHSIGSRTTRVRGTVRRVRLWLAMAAVALGAIAAAEAHADVVVRPPGHVRYLLTTLEGQAVSLAGGGAPDHGFFRVVNPTSTRVTVALDSLLLLGAQGTTRLVVTSVMANNHPVNPSSISVRGHSNVYLMVFFSGVPAGRTHDQRFVVRLAARIEGTVQRADCTITRAGRRPLP